MSIRHGGRPGPAWGGLLAGSLALFLALALLVHAGARLLLGDSVPLPLSGLSLVRLCIAYLVGGMVAGTTFDWLLVRATRREEVIAGGFVSAIPFLAGIRIAVEGVANWTVGDVLRIAGLSLIAGLFAGGSARRPRVSSRSADKPR